MQRKGHKMGIMFIYLHIFLKLRGFFFWTDTERDLRKHMSLDYCSAPKRRVPLLANCVSTQSDEIRD